MFIMSNTGDPDRPNAVSTKRVVEELQRIHVDSLEENERMKALLWKPTYTEIAEQQLSRIHSKAQMRSFLLLGVGVFAFVGPYCRIGDDRLMTPR